MKQNSFILSLCLIFIVSCDEVVYLRNDEKPVLVLYAVLEAGCDSMRIELTETKGTYDKTPWQRFPEAEVRVYEDGELLGMAEYQPADSSFVLRQPVKAERTYRIEARVAGKGTVWGETRVPEEVADCHAELWFEHKGWGTPRWIARYRWKDSVGPVENRPLNENRWQYTFKYRFYPDYYQSYGLGFYEYFLLSEDIGAEPLPVLSCGLACQFQNTDESAHQSVDELQEYVDDALDLIEFANGGTDTEWGALRAEMGHPEPFGLKFIGIGNEQWGETYPEHLEPFIEAIREAYPEIKIVGSSGPNSEGADFDYLWPEMKRLGADLVDEHFYRPEKWFLAQGARYDGYDRKGPKVFAGEYACHGDGKKWNHFEASLLEAAFMTGLERNADIVHMATYAPLFAHVEGWQWRPDLIWYDNLRSMRSCSYYVQQLYTTYKGTNVLGLKAEDGRNVTGAEGQHGLFASSVLDADKDRIYIKIANVSDEPREVRFDFEGLRRNEVLNGVEVVTYHSDDLDADNTLDEPERIVPQSSPLAFSGSSLETVVAPKTFAIYVLER